MNNRIQEIMDLEHFKTLTPIQEQVLNRKNKNRDIVERQAQEVRTLLSSLSLTLSLCPSLKN